MLLFAKKLKRRKDGSTDKEESFQVYKQAEKKWIKHVQKGNLNNDKYQEMKSTLSLYQDSEGVVRCQGRISLSSLPYDTKFLCFFLENITLRDWWSLSAMEKSCTMESRNTDFPIIFVGNAGQEHVSEH